MSDPASEPHVPATAWRPDVLDALLASTLAALLAWSWIAIVAAEAGVFTRLWTIGVGPAVGVAAALLAWRALRPIARGSAVASLLLAGVLLLAGLLTSRPAEYLVDGSDGSVYLNIGRAVARYGGLQLRHSLLATIPERGRDALVARERHPPRVFNLFPGGIQVAPGSDAAQPNFFHLFPVWIALAETIAGPRAGYYVSPLACLVAVAAFWLLARLLTSSAIIATLGTLLLLSSFGQIWFARLTTTEVMTQALVISGVLGAMWTYRGAPPVAGALAGAAFGLAALTRIDVLFFVLPVVAGTLGVVYVEGRWSRGWTWCAVVLGLLAIHAAAHALLVSEFYTRRIAYYMLRGRSVTTASRLVPPLVLLCAVAALVASRWMRRSGRAARWLPWALFGGVLAAAAWRIWPQVTAGPLSLLLTPWGVVAAFAGIGLYVRAERSAAAVLLAGLLLTSLLVYGESAREMAAMPMPLRRFVPVVLPLSVLAIAWLLHRLWMLPGGWRWTAIGVWALLMAMWIGPTRAIVQTAPMRGVHDQIARLADVVPPDAIVIADASTPSHLPLSLWATFGRNVLFVTPSKQTAAALGVLARSTPRPIVLLRGPGPGALDASHVAELSLSAPAVESLTLPLPETTSDRLPRALAPATVPLELYVAAPRRAPMVPAMVEIGHGDFASAFGGFHAPEQMGAVSGRWSTGEARVLLPPMPSVTQAAVTLRVAAPRPDSLPQPRIRVMIDGTSAGETGPVDRGFSELQVDLPPAALVAASGRPAVLTLRTPTFVPSAHGMGADDRQLGIVVDWVRVDRR